MRAVKMHVHIDTPGGCDQSLGVVALEMLVISFCLFADRVCVVPSVVWLSKLPRESKSQLCERLDAPEIAVLPLLSVPVTE